MFIYTIHMDWPMTTMRDEVRWDADMTHVRGFILSDLVVLYEACVTHGRTGGVAGKRCG